MVSKDACLDAFGSWGAGKGAFGKYEDLDDREEEEDEISRARKQTSMPCRHRGCYDYLEDDEDENNEEDKKDDGFPPTFGTTFG
ncbi:hypothetical protein GOP47_0010728 [Adiantum capillus-veneris]|uniref:Uncharacterized protein n=1 Tax=Adiantum capillus-veneris TaxID=13818 RepID=A0A9D4ZI30_ADICA|nr:hypothetical protein GOP47_0010728 [Adiantum capillus-veneris]